MKTQPVLFVLVITFACFIFSCKDQKNDWNDQLLLKAGQLVEQHPDSALVFLDSIDTNILSEAQHFDFVLLQVQAKDKADMDITSEIDIFRAVDYFVDKKDSKKTASAYFYAGKVHQVRAAYQNAMTAYMEALKYAGDKEYHLKGLIQNNIGHLHYEQMYLNEAADWFRKAYHSYKNEENRPSTYYHNANVLISIGNAQVLVGVADSALVYYRKALDIARTQKDTTLQIWTIQNIGYTYHNLQDYDNAKKEYLQALKLSRSEHERVMSDINMVQIHLDENKMDSAFYYKSLLDKDIDNIKDTATLANTYRLYVEIEDRFGNTQTALNYAKKQIECLENLYEKQITQSVLDVQKRYDFESLLNDRSKLQIEKRERQNWINILIALIILFCIVTISFYMTQKMKIQRK